MMFRASDYRFEHDGITPIPVPNFHKTDESSPPDFNALCKRVWTEKGWEKWERDQTRAHCDRTPRKMVMSMFGPMEMPDEKLKGYCSWNKDTSEVMVLPGAMEITDILAFELEKMLEMNFREEDKNLLRKGL